MSFQKLSTTVLLAVVAAGGALAQQPAPPASLQNVHRVVMLGDSITQFGDGPGGYVWLVRHYLADLYPSQKIETLNAGISGNKSNDMIARYQADVLDKKPDLLAISVGVNDVWHGFYDNHPLGDGPRGLKIEDYRRNVEEMVTKAEAIGTRVVLLAATPIYEDLSNRENAKQASYNGVLKDIAKKHHLIYVDYQKAMRDLITTYRKRTGARDNFLTVDGVHMNAEGNKVMAHTLLNALGISPEARAAVQGQVAKEMSQR